MPNTVPVAIISPAEQEVVVGSVVKLDGRSSFDPDDDDITYAWSFKQVPIGSQVESFGFTDLESDSSVVSFAPDLTGTYKIQLIVSDATDDSEPTESLVDVRVILVPNHQGLVPDAGFIWNYLSDFWNMVPDKRRFEVVWSSMIQVVASEMLKLYQYQYNRSIRDIQETVQKRWVHFTPGLDLDRKQVSFILSEETAGSSATTTLFDSKTGLSEDEQPTYSSIVTVSKTEGDFTRTSFGNVIAKGRLLQLGERTFTLARSNTIFESLNYDTDGATSGTDIFTGSQFTSLMVGSTLRILGPATSPLLGDYVIETFVNSTQVEIETPPVGITWAGASGLEYTVLPALAQHTSFFADRVQVPAALEDQFWRMSSTLISDQYDFEEQGVSTGDIIEIEVLRLDLQVLSTFFVQVTGVDRNRLSFVFNLEDLVPGTAAEGLSSDIQTTLATDLIVPGLSADINGELIYALDAEVINSTVTSTRFRREYFEKVLTTSDQINLGSFSITARPVRIIRNSKISIDTDIVSIPILQEYVKQPEVIEEGSKIYFAMDDTRVEVPRVPYLIAENLDYIIDDESTVSGTCETTQGDDEVTIPYGDLIDRSVAEGDILEVTHGTTVETFDIRRVLSADTLQVAPVATITSISALFTIRRRVAGKFIRFIDGTFSKTAPAPTRLWSEVTYFDNAEAIESNFGILVGIRREDLVRVDSAISYKSAVAGLMYALSRGPTISNLALSGHILLGLPFSQNAGVIREINPEFRKREDGSPLYGRILIEGRDRNNNPTGVTNIYFYPQGRQLFDSISSKWVPAVPDFSGLAINPETAIEYAVGDSVAQFTQLSKGVEIQEYLSTPDWIDRIIAQGDIASQLRKYHSFQIIVNSDLVTFTDIDLVSQFIKKAKAHYVHLSSAILKSLEDIVEIEDSLTFTRSISFFESSDLGAPTAAKLDDDDASRGVLSIDGVFYTRYLYGEDLVTTQDSADVQSAAGGFIDPRAGEEWDAPLLRPGDVLSLVSGHNAGKYDIVAINSDQEVELDLDGRNFETAEGQEFLVYRPLRNPIWSGEVTITTGDEEVSVEAPIRSSGASVGDLLVFADLATLNPTVSRVYTIIAVDSVDQSLTVMPDPSEASGTYDAWIVREGIMTSGVIEPFGSSGEEFYIAADDEDLIINFEDTGSNVNSWLNVALLKAGSIIDIDGVPHIVLSFDQSSRRAYIFAFVAGTHADKQVTINLRPEKPTTPASVDFGERTPSDSLELELVSSETTGDLLATQSGMIDVSPTVEPIRSFARPGDFVHILEGADSIRDIGFGPGVFPIHSYFDSDPEAHLTEPLTATGTFRYGIIRKVP
jgi:hypothetical protein